MVDSLPVDRGRHDEGRSGLTSMLGQKWAEVVVELSEDLQPYRQKASPVGAT